MAIIHQFLRDASGANVVEYSLLLALIALAAVGSMSLLGSPALVNAFTRANECFPGGS